MGPVGTKDVLQGHLFPLYFPLPPPPQSPCPCTAPAPGGALRLTHLLHTITMTTTAMRNTSPAAEEPMMSGSFSWTLVWYSAGMQGRGKGLPGYRMGVHQQVHQGQSMALSTAYTRVAAAVGGVLSWTAHAVSGISSGGCDRGCAPAGRLDVAIPFEWESSVPRMHAVPCSLASGAQNWLGLFYLAAQI